MLDVEDAKWRQRRSFMLVVIELFPSLHLFDL